MQRIHIGLNVTDLTNSIDFYSKIFDGSPVKVKEDYAKFLPNDVALNFTLNLRDQVNGNQVGHFGIQVDTLEEVLAHKDRLEKLGFFAREEMNTNCCYALQDKFWVTDPDGNEWEFFFTKQDSESVTESEECCSTAEENITIK
ncbi:ArsI/CadI family heavy metal resistance metalloenzyme [Alkalihalobacillus macyae]|uniref:ArsI/CadI family heavy metal resistance metalloenzyme n=1 Tax=Guptibacillus hwajinpoensis TaxID=208199 RepID=UPI00273B7E69|nr:ArsI/CadI family heavy metal resistance metalloenzyme [Alkalihalobacillus macyae]MDP4549560.1 ArsI/CadI family heavy metal resistance metalloenzyme [Alkalihalobacillus macyae]